MRVPMSNVLYYGDNLPVLRKWVADETVDLVYLDPPFNSKRMYNQIFKGSEAQAGIFKDYWEWDDVAEAAYREITGAGSRAPRALVILLEALYRVLEKDRDTLGYLSLMSQRLLELHRVLKPTGSLYLHCDPTASHHLRLILDAIFDAENFLSEIVWKRYGAHGDARRYGAVHDNILFYGKSKDVAFTKQFVPYTEEYAASRFKFVDKDGRRYQEQNLSSPNPRPNLTYPYTASNGVTYHPHKNGWKCELERMRELDREGRLHFPKDPKGRLRLKMYLDECEGVPLQDVWTDIIFGSSSKERIGWPTQKPRELLERIVQASSKLGDLVLDPFCGCGTTIEACERLGREWFGIDVAPEAVDIIRERMAKIGADVNVKGWPEDMRGAVRLAKDDKVGFQRWAVFKAGGRLPDGRQYKGGADGGVDGEILYSDGDRKQRAIISVKAGGVGADDIRVLRNVVQDTRSQMGIYVSMLEPTKAMRDIAREGGFITDSKGREYRKIQLLTIEQIIDKGEAPDLPGHNVTPDSVRPEPRKGENLTFQFTKTKGTVRGAPEKTGRKGATKSTEAPASSRRSGRK